MAEAFENAHRHWSQHQFRSRTTEEWSAIEADTHDEIYPRSMPFESPTLEFTIERALWYEDYAYKLGRRWDRGDRTKKFLQLLDLPSLPGKRVLDVGCGFGQYAVLCAKAGAEVTGVELSPVGVHRAKELAAANKVSDRCTFLVGDIVQQNLPAEHFDIVYLHEVFHHAVKYPGLKEALARVTAPGGRILIADPVRGGAPIEIGRRIVKYFRFYGRPDLREEEENKGDVPIVLADFREFARGFSGHTLHLMNFFYMIKEADWIKSRRKKLAIRLLMRAAHYTDAAMLAVFPFMRKHCAEVILEIRK